MEHVKKALFVLAVVAIAARVPMLDKIVFNQGA
jgi:hypothetical protein